MTIGRGKLEVQEGKKTPQMNKRKEAMKGSKVPLLAFQNVSVLSSQKNKAAKVQNMTKHLSQASKSMSHFFSHKRAQRRNSDLTVTGKRSVPNFQNVLNASEVCNSLIQDSKIQEISFIYLFN